MAAGYDASGALVVVDVQNDFADPGGSLYVRDGERTVRRIDEEIDAARSAGSSVVYTQDWHPPDTPHFAKDGGIWPVHCVRDSWGAAFHPDLLIDGDVVRKGEDGGDGYSGFSVRDLGSGETSSTILAELLRRRGVRQLVVVGLATDYCVVETVLDGRGLGFEVTVLREAIRAVDLEPGDGERSIERMAASGATIV